ncbi:MAG TPA: hypothetical protein VM695_10195 [Phycisphaerae bacterium]|nr:hypothetical protein [Phycisphaerae bacterium]
MSNELNCTYPSGNTVYAIVRRVSDSAVWDTVAGDWAVWADGSIANYDVPLTDRSGDVYSADFPSGLVGRVNVRVNFYKQAAGAPAVTDLVIGAPSRAWFWVGALVPGATGGSRTLAELIVNVRRLIREATEKEHTDGDITYALDNALAEVWELVARIPHASYCTVVSDAINLVAETDEYNIPANMIHIQTVQVLESTGSTHWQDIDPAGPRQMEDGRSPYTYTLLKSTVLLRPIPIAAVTGGLRFIGTESAGTFDADDATSGLPPVLDQVLEQFAAALLLLTEGNAMAGAFETRGRTMLDRLLTVLARRHEGPRSMAYERE